MNCHACGTSLAATARFCHKCGAAVAATTTTGWRAGLPWAVAGAAVGALAAVLAMRAPAPGPGSTGQTAPGVRLPAPDISQMSPEEAANRLFDRVMMAAETGKDDTVRFFLPMALAAYERLPALDPDARYHIGLLRLAGGEIGAALAQADSIARTIPTHLFIYVLRAHAYQQQGNRQQERRAYADFLRHEAAELARDRPEYTDHRNALNAFRAAAQRLTGS